MHIHVIVIWIIRTEQFFIFISEFSRFEVEIILFCSMPGCLFMEPSGFSVHFSAKNFLLFFYIRVYYNLNYTVNVRNVHELQLLKLNLILADSKSKLNLTQPLIKLNRCRSKLIDSTTRVRELYANKAINTKQTRSNTIQRDFYKVHPCVLLILEIDEATEISVTFFESHQ